MFSIRMDFNQRLMALNGSSKVSHTIGRGFRDPRIIARVSPAGLAFNSGWRSQRDST
jgi:hypothetical protein